MERSATQHKWIGLSTKTEERDAWRKKKKGKRISFYVGHVIRYSFVKASCAITSIFCTTIRLLSSQVYGEIVLLLWYTSCEFEYYYNE
jgi:hypothetical protein